MRFLNKRTAGFSLLELMVVVAIIGVLATVAVPRFNIFRARARQGEAKSNLGVIFTLQEAFKIDKEQYYDGDDGTWGGEAMQGYANASGYRGGARAAVTTGPRRNRRPASAGGSECPSNKLGFRLANCNAARYGYYIVGANEDEFMAYAFSPSDIDKRIFPGCAGDDRENTMPNTTKSGKPPCTNQWDGVAAEGNGGDAFCLDQQRTVDNFIDIVGSETCND